MEVVLQRRTSSKGCAESRSRADVHRAADRGAEGENPCARHPFRPQTSQGPDGGAVRKPTLISLWILLVVTAATAQRSSSQKQQLPEKWRASAGDFSAMVVFTDDPEEFLKEWSKPPESVPKISSVSSARRGDTVMAFVFFSGCKEKKETVTLRSTSSC